MFFSPQATFPHDAYPPTQGMQFVEGTGIPLAVFVDFFGPEFCPGCRQPEKTTVMAMPEATVNEDDCIIHGQHNVRSSGKFFDIDQVAEPAGEQLFPEEQLGFCIFASDTGHHPASGYPVDGIHVWPLFRQIRF